MLPVAALALAGCSSAGLGPERLTTPASVQAVPFGDRSPTQLAITAGCLDESRASVEESPSQVRLSYYLRTYDAKGDPVPACATRLVVPLRAPLAGRPLVDARSGERIEVQGAAGEVR